MAKHPPTEANMATENTRNSAKTVLLTMVVTWLCQPERKIRSINTKRLSKIRLIHSTFLSILYILTLLIIYGSRDHEFVNFSL